MKTENEKEVAMEKFEKNKKGNKWLIKIINILLILLLTIPTYKYLSKNNNSNFIDFIDIYWTIYVFTITLFVFLYPRLKAEGEEAYDFLYNNKFKGIDFSQNILMVSHIEITKTKRYKRYIRNKARYNCFNFNMFFLLIALLSVTYLSIVNLFPEQYIYVLSALVIGITYSNCLQISFYFITSLRTDYDDGIKKLIEMDERVKKSLLEISNKNEK